MGTRHSTQASTASPSSSGGSRTAPPPAAQYPRSQYRPPGSNHSHRPGHSNRHGHGQHRLINLSDIKCPVCNKTVRCIDDFEVHVVMCLTRPKLTYNEETVDESKGEECVICFEDFVQGETIARLPCLCIYHKHCLDDWFKINNVCPQHPPDD